MPFAISIIYLLSKIPFHTDVHKESCLAVTAQRYSSHENRCDALEKSFSFPGHSLVHFIVFLVVLIVTILETIDFIREIKGH